MPRALIFTLAGSVWSMRAPEYETQYFERLKPECLTEAGGGFDSIAPMRIKIT